MNIFLYLYLWSSRIVGWPGLRAHLGCIAGAARAPDGKVTAGPSGHLGRYTARPAPGLHFCFVRGCHSVLNIGFDKLWEFLLRNSSSGQLLAKDWYEIHPRLASCVSIRHWNVGEAQWLAGHTGYCNCTWAWVCRNTHSICDTYHDNILRIEERVLAFFEFGLYVNLRLAAARIVLWREQIASTSIGTHCTGHE